VLDEIDITRRSLHGFRNMGTHGKPQNPSAK
jgi:hypothetical protein